jgi:hypothetical protein
LSRVEDPEKSPVRAVGATEPPTPFDSRLESKAHESSIHESRDALARELKLPNARFGVSIRTAATVGFLAIVALLFMILMPGFRRADTASSFSADVQQFMSGLSPQSRDRQSSEDTAKPAIEQFQRLLASSNEPAAQADRDPSDKLLRRFMQWRLKTNSAENAQ